MSLDDFVGEFSFPDETFFEHKNELRLCEHTSCWLNIDLINHQHVQLRDFVMTGPALSAFVGTDLGLSNAYGAVRCLPGGDLSFFSGVMQVRHVLALANRTKKLLARSHVYVLYMQGFSQQGEIQLHPKQFYHATFVRCVGHSKAARMQSNVFIGQDVRALLQTGQASAQCADSVRALGTHFDKELKKMLNESTSLERRIVAAQNRHQYIDDIEKTYRTDMNIRAKCSTAKQQKILSLTSNVSRDLQQTDNRSPSTCEIVTGVYAERTALQSLKVLVKYAERFDQGAAEGWEDVPGPFEAPTMLEPSPVFTFEHYAPMGGCYNTSTPSFSIPPPPSPLPAPTKNPTTCYQHRPKRGGGGRNSKQRKF